MLRGMAKRLAPKLEVRVVQPVDADEAETARRIRAVVDIALDSWRAHRAAMQESPPPTPVGCTTGPRTEATASGE